MAGTAVELERSLDHLRGPDRRKAQYHEELVHGWKEKVPRVHCVVC